MMITSVLSIKFHMNNSNSKLSGLLENTDANLLFFSFKFSNTGDFKLFKIDDFLVGYGFNLGPENYAAK